MTESVILTTSSCSLP